jgi:Dolichyl-phosphate-mannose-protein mannosyltransferase
MLTVANEFRIGRPQVIAGLLLLAFFCQCLWVAQTRHLSDVEFSYLAATHASRQGEQSSITSPFTVLAASVPLRVTDVLRRTGPAALRATLAVPRTWVLRLPFVAFGLWLGAALWWVARRLFGDEGGYIALALYCFSPVMVMISSNIGPEIILAWSSFGLIYAAIGVAHTVYSPPRKWPPRIVLLGLSMGIAVSTTLWACTLVLLAFAFMFYLAPGRRRAALFVFACAVGVGLAVFAITAWFTGSGVLAFRALITPHLSWGLLTNLGFALNRDSDGYVLIALFILVFTTYASWKRARYFGNSAPLLTAFAAVFLVSLVPALQLWPAALGVSFLFLFVGGVMADLLETDARRWFLWIVLAASAIKIVEDLNRLRWWIHQ